MSLVKRVSQELKKLFLHETLLKLFCFAEYVVPLCLKC